MGWKVVEIETNEYLKLYLNNVLIERPSEKIIININDIDLLIFHNDRASVSIKLLNALTSANISVIFMNQKKEPSSYLIPVNGHHISLKVLEKQIAWTNVYKGTQWQKIVQNKIANQASLLRKLGLQKAEAMLNSYVADVKRFDITNREGFAAKVYWNSLFGKDFVRDQKAIRNTIINSMLNYGYAILRSLMISSIIKRGLDSRISLFHKSASNFFALASDLMEPYRPLVDEVVYEHKDAQLFSLNIRDKLIGLWENKPIIKDKRFHLSKTMTIMVENLISQAGSPWIELWDFC